MKGNIVISAEESNRYERRGKERGGVALYMAAYLGLQRMLNMLLSVGKRFLFFNVLFLTMFPDYQYFHFI